MTAEQTISERIERVLAEHRPVWSGYTDAPGYSCSCGYPSCDADLHRAHVTAALLAAGILQEVDAFTQFGTSARQASSAMVRFGEALKRVGEALAERGEK